MIQDTDADNLSTIVNTDIGADGMKIDRELYLYKSWEEDKVYKDQQIAIFMSAGQYDDAEKIIRERYENKPTEFMTLEKIARIEGINYKLTWKEVLHKIFCKLAKYPTREEKIKQAFLEFKQFAQISNEDHKELEAAFTMYLIKEDFANCINNREFPKLEPFGFTMNMIRKIEVHNLNKMKDFVHSCPALINLRARSSHFGQSNKIT